MCPAFIDHCVLRRVCTAALAGKPIDCLNKNGLQSERFEAEQILVLSVSFVALIEILEW